jgi:predicted permease
VLNIITPIFGIVALGFVLARAGVLSAAASEALTRFMFYVAVPALLFRTLATTALPPSVPWAYIAAFYGASFITFVLGIAFARWGLDWSRRDQGIAGITAGYSNMVMLGFPLVITAFGDAGALPLFILIALQSMLLFPATTWVIEVYGRTDGAKSRSALAMLGKLAMNPVIASLLLGIGTNMLGVPVPDALARGLDIIGAAAPACALTALGLGLAQYEIRGAVCESSGLVVLKTCVHPALVWVACAMFDIPALWTHVAVVLAAMPTGINAFIFARQYDARIEVVSKTIVFSTIISVFTVAALLQHVL